MFAYFCYGKRILVQGKPIRKLVFNKPLCDNVTLKHLPSIEVFCPGCVAKALSIAFV